MLHVLLVPPGVREGEESQAHDVNISTLDPFFLDRIMSKNGRGAVTGRTGGACC